MRLQRNNRNVEVNYGFPSDYKRVRLREWEKQAHDWSEHTRYDTFHIRSHNYIVGLLSSSDGCRMQSLIDLGCGPGHFLNALRSRQTITFKRLAGVDFCETALSIARTTNSRYSMPIIWHPADLEQPLANVTGAGRSFDAATAIFLLDEVQNLPSVFAHALTALRSGGIFVCAMCDGEREKERWKFEGALTEPIVLSKPLVTPDGEELPGRYFTVIRPLEELQNAARSAGFKPFLSEAVNADTLNSRRDGPSLRVLAWKKT